MTQGNIDILTILFLCITTYIYLERDDAVGPALFHQVNVSYLIVFEVGYVQRREIPTALLVLSCPSYLVLCVSE